MVFAGGEGVNEDDRPTHLSLFSGLDGFTLACERAGFRTIGFSEINPYSCAWLRKRWPDVPNLGDITDESTAWPYADLLTGGWPCQPFSIAGPKLGERDDRHLWPAMLRVVSKVRPTWIIGENVVNSANMVLSGCLDDLEGLGYQSAVFDLPSCSVGLPSVERHLWIIAESVRERLEGGSEAHFQNIRFEGEILSEWGKITAGAQGWPGRWDLPMPGILRSTKGLPGYVGRIVGIGNAVPPPIAYIFAKAIYSILRPER